MICIEDSDSNKHKGKYNQHKISKIEDSIQDDNLDSKTISKQSHSASESSGIVFREAKIEELNNMVVMKKGTDINEYLDPNYYDSNNPSPEVKDPRGLNIDNKNNLPAFQNQMDLHYENNHFLTTSPILEEGKLC